MEVFIYFLLVGLIILGVLKLRNLLRAKRDAKHIARVEKELQKIREKDNK